jgi:hypothetical protein
MPGLAAFAGRLGLCVPVPVRASAGARRGGLTPGAGGAGVPLKANPRLRETRTGGIHGRLACHTLELRNTGGHLGGGEFAKVECWIRGYASKRPTRS